MAGEGYSLDPSTVLDTSGSQAMVNRTITDEWTHPEAVTQITPQKPGTLAVLYGLSENAEPTTGLKVPTNFYIDPDTSPSIQAWRDDPDLNV